MKCKYRFRTYLGAWLLAASSLWGMAPKGPGRPPQWVYEFLSPAQVDQALVDESSLWGLACAGEGLGGTLSAGVMERINYQLNRLVREVLVKRGLWDPKASQEHNQLLETYFAVDWFDAVAGASTGALQAAALTVHSPESALTGAPYSASDLLDFYFSQGDFENEIPVFKPEPEPSEYRYDAGSFEDFLYCAFGLKTHADTCLKIPLLIFAKNLRSENTLLLGAEASEHIFIKDSCRASCASAALFPPHQIEGDVYGACELSAGQLAFRVQQFLAKNKNSVQKVVLVSFDVGPKKGTQSQESDLDFFRELSSTGAVEYLPVSLKLTSSIPTEGASELTKMQAILEWEHVGPCAYSEDGVTLPAFAMVFNHPQIQALYDRLKGRLILRLSRIIDFFESSAQHVNLCQQQIQLRGGERFCRFYFHVFEYLLSLRAGDACGGIKPTLRSGLMLRSLSLEGVLHPKIHLNDRRFERLMRALLKSQSLCTLRTLNLGKNGLGTLPEAPKAALAILMEFFPEGPSRLNLLYLSLDENEFNHHTPGGLSLIHELIRNLPDIFRLDLSKNAFPKEIKRVIEANPAFGKIKL